MSNTLYANENVVSLWNADTDEYEKIKAQQEEDAALQAIEEGRALAQLQQHSGFALLESYLLATIQDLKNKLTVESDYKRFRRLQEAVKAYSNVLGFVNFKVHEGRALESARTPEEEK